ncbi:MAG: NAD-dependent protein deacylase [Clostridia bacterium]|nr:NAD-dependent protein deacylase [Clostridia bacterium]
MDSVKELKKIIDGAEYLVFMGGAGVSTESGIPDFRSPKGLYSEKYKRYSPEKVLSRDFFLSHTAEFYDYYKNNMLFPDAVPNAAHIALSKLEKKGKLKAVITQNIDGLHFKAGSKNVIELHGSVLRNRCLRCGKEYDLKDVIDRKGVPCCDICGGVIKPEVVLYGENLSEDAITLAIREICKADTLIVGGTSLMVNPAAAFVGYFKGKNLVIINKEPTPYDSFASLIIREPIAEVFSKLVK